MQRLRYGHRFHGLENPIRPSTYEWMVSVVCSCDAFVATPLLKQALIRTIGRLFAAGCVRGSTTNCVSKVHGCVVNARSHLEELGSKSTTASAEPSVETKLENLTIASKRVPSAEICCACGPAVHARLHGLIEALAVIVEAPSRWGFKAGAGLSGRGGDRYHAVSFVSPLAFIAAQTEKYLAEYDNIELVRALCTCLATSYGSPDQPHRMTAGSGGGQHQLSARGASA